MSSINAKKNELDELVENISRPTFKFMRRVINRELDRLKLKNKKENIEMNFIINLIVISLASLDTNILIMTRNVFKKTTDQELDFATLMHTYFQNVTSIMNQDELMRLKEKMN